MNNLIASLMSRKMKMAPTMKLLFLILPLLIIDSVLSTNWSLKNGFQKLKVLSAMNMNSMLLLWLTLIDSGADMDWIQEGIVPSKYYEKSTEKLFSANGTQMKIKYEINTAHVCHENVCFKIPSVLVKNMTNKVILDIPFINILYPFLTEHDGITTNPFG